VNARARVSPAGEYAMRELDKKGWTQADLADILGRPVQVVNEIISGKRGITPDTARGLAAAFGTTPELWMNLDAQHQLAKTQEDPAVAVRARIFDKGPIKEMVRRGWLPPSDDVTMLGKAVLNFFELNSLEDEPRFYGHAARKATDYRASTPGQTAWLFRAKQIAQDRLLTPEGKFSKAALQEAVHMLRKLLPTAEGTALVADILSRAGIRFLVLEHLPQTRIDGACFWLDDESPVVVIAFRYDRIDYFWHTIFHELAHVEAGDGLTDDTYLDVDLVGGHLATLPVKPPLEQEADRYAADAIVPEHYLETFIHGVRPAYSRTKILTFASQMGVHAGIVVGQLQHRGEIQYSHSRDLLVKVRKYVIESAVTDGWDKTFSPA